MYYLRYEFEDMRRNVGVQSSKHAEILEDGELDLEAALEAALEA